MAGVKGRSGRRPYLQEKTIEQICRMSALAIYHALRSPDSEISKEKKAELGKHFVLRVMPQKIESDGSLAPKTVVIIRAESNDVGSRIQANQLIA